VSLAASLGAAIRRFARAIGIILIFSVVGPLTFATLVLLMVVGCGAPLLQLLLAFVDHGTLFTTASVAGWLLTIAMLMGSFPPYVVAGSIFAPVAVYAGMNALWMAWLAVAVAIIGVLVLGSLAIPHESSVIILPNIQSARQALASFAVLAALAIPPTTLCWLLAQPLSRGMVST
jgi:hypothetical protein